MYFTCTITSNDYENPLSVGIVYNDRILFHEKITEECVPKFEIIEDNNPGMILFIVSGKTDIHTVVENDTIKHSAEISITDIEFEGIHLNNHIQKHPLVYKHDRNGSTDTVLDKFYQTAGFNGIIELPFETPIYDWALENIES
jgi:hypothetical protein